MEDIIKALQEFYDHYDPQNVPDKLELENVAKTYAGNEKVMWQELYRHYDSANMPDDATIGELASLQNPFSNVKKKEVASPQPSGVSSEASSTANAPSAGTDFDYGLNDLAKPSSAQADQPPADNEFDWQLADFARAQEPERPRMKVGRGGVYKTQEFQSYIDAEKRRQPDESLVKVDTPIGPRYRTQTEHDEITTARAQNLASLDPTTLATRPDFAVSEYYNKTGKKNAFNYIEQGRTSEKWDLIKESETQAIGYAELSADLIESIKSVKSKIPQQVLGDYQKSKEILAKFGNEAQQLSTILDNPGAQNQHPQALERLQEIQNDPDFIQAQSVYQSLSQNESVALYDQLIERYWSAQEGLKRSKVEYPDYYKRLEDQSKKQGFVDLVSRIGMLPEDLINPIAGRIARPVLRELTSFASGIATFPAHLRRAIDPGAKYNFIDRFAEDVNRALDIDASLATIQPSNRQRQVVERVADVDGFKVFVDRNGNVNSVRDSEGYVVRDQDVSETIAKKFSDNKSKYPTTTDVSTAPVIDVIAQAVTQLGISTIPGRLAAPLGKAVSTGAVIGTQTARFTNDFYKEAIQQLGQDNRGLAERYAIGLALATSSINMAIQPLETTLGETVMKPIIRRNLLSMFDDLASGMNQNMVYQRALKNTIKELSSSIGKTVGKEGLEGVLESVAEQSAKEVVNTVADPTRSMSPDWSPIEFTNAFIEEALGALPFGAQDFRPAAQFQQEALYAAYSSTDKDVLLGKLDKDKKAFIENVFAQADAAFAGKRLSDEQKANVITRIYDAEVNKDIAKKSPVENETAIANVESAKEDIAEIINTPAPTSEVPKEPNEPEDPIAVLSGFEKARITLLEPVAGDAIETPGGSVITVVENNGEEVIVQNEVGDKTVLSKEDWQDGVDAHFDEKISNVAVTEEEKALATFVARDNAIEEPEPIAGQVDVTEPAPNAPIVENTEQTQVPTEEVPPAPPIEPKPKKARTKPVSTNTQSAAKIKKIKAALKKVSPGIKIVEFQSNGEAIAFVRDKYGKDLTGKVVNGFYDKESNTIYQNREAKEDTVLSHEAIEAYVAAAAIGDKIDDFYAQLSVSPLFKRSGVDKFIEAYGDEQTKKKEAIVEFVARVADGRVELSNAVVEKLKKLFNSFMELIGFDPDYIENETDVIEFARRLSDALKTGREIDIKPDSPSSNTDTQPDVSAPIAGAQSEEVTAGDAITEPVPPVDETVEAPTAIEVSEVQSPNDIPMTPQPALLPNNIDVDALIKNSFPQELVDAASLLLMNNEVFFKKYSNETPGGKERLKPFLDKRGTITNEETQKVLKALMESDLSNIKLPPKNQRLQITERLGAQEVDIKPAQITIKKSSLYASLDAVSRDRDDAYKSMAKGVFYDSGRQMAIATEGRVFVAVPTQVGGQSYFKQFELQEKKESIDAADKYVKYDFVFENISKHNTILEAPIDSSLDLLNGMIRVTSMYNESSPFTYPLIKLNDTYYVSPALAMTTIMAMAETGTKTIAFKADETSKMLSVWGDNGSIGVLMPIEVNEKANINGYVSLDKSKIEKWSTRGVKKAVVAKEKAVPAKKDETFKPVSKEVAAKNKENANKLLGKLKAQIDANEDITEVLREFMESDLNGVTLSTEQKNILKDKKPKTSFKIYDVVKTVPVPMAVTGRPVDEVLIKFVDIKDEYRPQFHAVTYYENDKSWMVTDGHTMIVQKTDEVPSERFVFPKNYKGNKNNTQSIPNYKNVIPTIPPDANTIEINVSDLIASANGAVKSFLKTDKDSAPIISIETGNGERYFNADKILKLAIGLKELGHDTVTGYTHKDKEFSAFRLDAGDTTALIMPVMKTGSGKDDDIFLGHTEFNPSAAPEFSISNNDAIGGDMFPDPVAFSLTDPRYVKARQAVAMNKHLLATMPLNKFTSIIANAYNVTTADVEAMVKAEEVKAAPFVPSLPDSFKHTKFGEAIGKFADKWISPSQGVPTWMASAVASLSGSTNASAQRTATLARQASKMIKKKNIPEANVDAYLKGDKTAVSDPEVMELLDDMRKQIDDLSRAMIDEGYVRGDAADIVEANIGTYMARRYKIFEQENWAPPANIKEAAIQYVMANTSEYASDKITGAMTPAQLRTWAENRVEDMLVSAKNEISSHHKSGKIGSKDISIMMKRDDLPKEIRQLFGEYDADSPISAWTLTMAKLDAHVQSARFLNHLRVAGTGNVFFKRNDPNRPLGANYRIAADSSKPYYPLNGMYTFPEVAEFLQKSEGIKTIPWLAFLGSVANWSATVGSYASHAVNFVGNLYFMLGNGYLADIVSNPIKTIRAMHDAVLAVSSDLGLIDRYGRQDKRRSLNRQRIQDIITLLKNNGVTDTELNTSVITNLLDSADSRSFVERWLSGPGGGLGAWLEKNMAVGIPSRLYKSGDNIFKFFAFLVEAQRYAKAIYNKSYSDLNDAQRAAVDQRAIDVVVAILPNYNKLGGFARALARDPLIGSFVAFRFEVLRTLSNTVSLAANEMRDKRTASIGVKRMTGLILQASMRAAIVGHMGKLAGIGLGGVLGAFMDDDDEKEKNIATREFVPSFIKFNDLLITKMEKGEIKVLDLSAADPYSTFARLGNAMLYASGDDGKAESTAREIQKTFLSPTIIAATLSGLVTGYDTYGEKIALESKSGGDYLMEYAKWTGKMLAPRSFTAPFKVAESDKPGATLAAQLTGFREYTIDVNKVMRRYLNEYLSDDGIDKAFQKELYRLAIKPGMTEAEFARRSKEILDREKQALSEMHRIFALGTTHVGVSLEDTKDYLKNRRTSKRLQKAILYGEYTPVKLSKYSKLIGQ